MWLLDLKIDLGFKKYSFPCPHKLRDADIQTSHLIL